MECKIYFVVYTPTLLVQLQPFTKRATHEECKKNDSSLVCVPQQDRHDNLETASSRGMELYRHSLHYFQGPEKVSALGDFAGRFSVAKWSFFPHQLIFFHSSSRQLATLTVFLVR